MNKIRRKLKKLEWFGVFSIVMTVVWIIVLTFPVYWGFLSSTKDSLEAQRRPPKFFSPCYVITYPRICGCNINIPQGKLC